MKAGSFSMNMMPPGENIFNGLKYNIKLGSGLAMVQNAKDQVRMTKNKRFVGCFNKNATDCG